MKDAADAEIVGAFIETVSTSRRTMTVPVFYRGPVPYL
jgi:hypothetical protein